MVVRGLLPLSPSASPPPFTSHPSYQPRAPPKIIITLIINHVSSPRSTRAFATLIHLGFSRVQRAASHPTPFSLRLAIKDTRKLQKIKLEEPQKAGIRAGKRTSEGRKFVGAPPPPPPHSTDSGLSEVGE